MKKPDAKEEMVIGIKTVTRPEFHLSVLYLLTCEAESFEEKSSTTQMVNSFTDLLTLFLCFYLYYRFTVWRA